MLPAFFCVRAILRRGEVAQQKWFTYVKVPNAAAQHGFVCGTLDEIRERAPKSCLYVHFDEVRSRRAHDARNPNFNRARRTGDCRSRVVALPLMGRWSCCDAQSLTGSIL